jgi:hypothetical protein
VYDKVGTKKEVQFLSIMKLDKKNRIVKARLFTRDYEGVISEVP